MKTLAMALARRKSRLGRSRTPGALAASIEPASWHPSCRVPSGFLTGGSSNESHKIGGGGILLAER
jgi:hypothetical protein